MDNDDYDYLVESCLEVANREDYDNDVLQSLNEEINSLLLTIQ